MRLFTKAVSQLETHLRTIQQQCPAPTFHAYRRDVETITFSPLFIERKLPPCKVALFPYHANCKKLLERDEGGCVVGEDIDNDDHPFVVIIVIIAAIIAAVAATLIVLGVIGLLGLSGYLI